MLVSQYPVHVQAEAFRRGTGSASDAKKDRRMQYDAKLLPISPRSAFSVAKRAGP